MEETNLEIWKKSHKDSEQKKRLSSAILAENTPLSVDTIKKEGIFVGSHGKYETSLKHCTCVDFNRRKLPCKHMYRLAMELGIIKEKFYSDYDGRVKFLDSYEKNEQKKKKSISFENSIEILETLNDSSQLVLKTLLYETLYQKKEYVPFISKEREILSLENNSCIEVVDSPIHAFQAYPRNEMNEKLQKAGISGFKKNLKLEVLAKWCVDTGLDSKKILPEVQVIKLSDVLFKSRRKIYQYLVRKFDDDCYLDENGKEVFIPKGSEYITTVSLKNESSIKLQFPDDEITAQLNKFGKNRCNK